MKKVTGAFLSTFLLLNICLMSSCKNRKTTLDEKINQPAIIAGKILNRYVYPTTKEIVLTIPGFEGDDRIIQSELTDSGEFKFVFYPKTKREICLYPIEDVLIIQPGDSLYIVKDFRDITSTRFSGTSAKLNEDVSKFLLNYLGRYAHDYTASYLEFKNSCKIKKQEYQAKFEDFVKLNHCSDEFKKWAKAKIEMDYCKVLFGYPLQHYLRTNEEMKCEDEYYSFINDLEANFDNSTITVNHFKLAEEMLKYKVQHFSTGAVRPKPIQYMSMDSVLNSIINSTKKNYLSIYNCNLS